MTEIQSLTDAALMNTHLTAFVDCEVAIQMKDGGVVSFGQLYTVFIQILIIIHHLKLEVIFLTLLKHLIKFGMTVFYINLKVLGFLEMY